MKYITNFFNKTKELTWEDFKKIPYDLLTDEHIKNVNPLHHYARLMIGDAIQLVIYSSKTRCFFFRYKEKGKSKEYLLGYFPEVTLDMARLKASQAKINLFQNKKLDLPKIKNKSGRSHAVFQEATHKIQEAILGLSREGWSVSQISKHLNLSKKTVEELIIDRQSIKGESAKVAYRLDDSLNDKILELSNQGLTQRMIGRQLSIAASSVNTRLKKIKETNVKKIEGNDDDSTKEKIFSEAMPSWKELVSPQELTTEELKRVSPQELKSQELLPVVDEVMINPFLKKIIKDTTHYILPKFDYERKVIDLKDMTSGKVTYHLNSLQMAYFLKISESDFKFYEENEYIPFESISIARGNYAYNLLEVWNYISGNENVDNASIVRATPKPKKIKRRSPTFNLEDYYSSKEVIDIFGYNDSEALSALKNNYYGIFKCESALGSKFYEKKPIDQYCASNIVLSQINLADYYTLEEAADVLGRSYGTLQQWISRKREFLFVKSALSIKIPKKILLKKEDIDEFNITVNPFILRRK